MASKVALDDRVEIEELIARYAWALDTGDLDGYVACFVEDGWVEHPPEGRCVGREGLRRLTESLWYSQPNRYLGRQHQMSQIIMTREDGDVRIRCFWSILQQDAETQQCFVFALGSWDTIATRAEDAQWLFRSIMVDLWRKNGVPWVGDRRAFTEKALVAPVPVKAGGA